MLSLLNSASSSVISSLMGGMGNGGLGIAGDGGLMSTWDNTFLPELNSLIADANSYASPARIQQAMGAAEANVSQSFDQSRNNALHDLTSFGIDPSSGRYAQLDQASRMQEAAAQAGAGNIAEQQTEAIARSLRSEAIQATAQLPSQAAAMIGASAQAMQVQVNQELGLLNHQIQEGQLGIQQQNANTQAYSAQTQRYGLPNQNMAAANARGQQGNGSGSTADQNEAAAYNAMVAADAQQAKQGGQGFDSGYNPMASTSGQGNSSGDGGGGGGNRGMTTDSETISNKGTPNQGGGGGGGGSGSRSGSGPETLGGGYGPGGYAGNGADGIGSSGVTSGGGSWGGNTTDNSVSGDDPNMGLSGTPTDNSVSGDDPDMGLGDQSDSAIPDSQAPVQEADNSDVTANDATQDQGYTGLDAPQDTGYNAGDQGGEYGGGVPTDDNVDTDMNTGMPAPSAADASDSGGADTTADDGGSGDNSDNGSGGGEYGGGYSDDSGSDGSDSSGGDDTGGSDGTDDSFAAGGVIGAEQAVHARQGAIPASMSPSGGAATDDVPARLNGTGEQIRLNQGEFIMPKDVVGWNGESHYQKHIEKSRQQMAQAKARPTMKPAIPMHGGV